MKKPKLFISIQQAHHFLKWELPYFQKWFDVVDEPAEDAILFAFGPDVLASSVHLPCNRRVALLFPGFSFNPYHNMEHRASIRQTIDEHYDMVFVNPGPTHEAFKTSSKIRLCAFSIDTNRVEMTSPRTKIASLLHASADYPQKDWRRSEEIMRRSGLKYEVFPPRTAQVVTWQTRYAKWMNRNKRYLRHYLAQVGIGKFKTPKLPSRYRNHDELIHKYRQYDGFVHIAAETPPHVDGKYTATLLEAGLTGAILFWHDTLGLGNDFETIFNLPLDPESAAQRIVDISCSLNVEQHSRRTHQEILDRCHPDTVIRTRFNAMRELFE